MPATAPTLTNRDPKAGCLIMIIGALVFGGLILYTLLLPFQQAAKMAEFTQPEAMVREATLSKELPVDLRQKLKRVASQLREGPAEEAVQVAFDAQELNALIAGFAEFQELQGTLATESIMEKGAQFAISFPLRGRPFSEETPHLNGTMVASPQLQEGEVILQVSALSSVRGEVPEGFAKHFEEYRIMAPYLEHPIIGRAMTALTEVTLKEGALHFVLSAAQYQDPASLPTESQEKKDRSSQNLMLIVSFFLVGGLFFFMVKRRNAAAARALRQG